MKANEKTEREDTITEIQLQTKIPQEQDYKTITKSMKIEIAK